MKKLRKFLTVSVMVMTIVVMGGLGSLNTANAAAQAGDLIKMDGLSSVYYLGNDGKRYVFPSESVYFSWYQDFSSVVTIPASELQSYPLGANVTMRPGTKLVKITTDPSVYAVTPNGVLRKIQSESDAITLYGTNWSKMVVDVADAFFTNYTIGTPLTTGTYPAGTLLKNANNASIYYFDGTNYRMIASEAAFTANRFSWNNVITTSMTLTASGSSITGAETFAQPTGATSGPIVTGSGLSLALSSQTPMSVSIPKNGVRVPFTKVNLTAASDGAVTVNSMTVKRIGLSDSGDVDKVWAEHNGVIVASKKSMNSSDEAILVFSPALTIPAGQTVTLELLASLTGTGTGNIGLSVASASAVSATAASVTGSFPISGNLMSLIDYQVAKLALTGMNTASTAVKVGDEKVELGYFDMGFNTNGVSAKDVRVVSIMLKNNGVEDLTKTAMNLYLEHAGNKVTSGYTVDGRFVTFTFNDGFELLKDDGSKMLYLKGDVIAKENTGTNSYTFELNKSTDLVAYEKSTGFGVNTYTSSSGTTLADALQISAREIEAGAVSISKKATSPSATTIVKGTDHVVLLANIRADEQINADGMKIWYGSGSSAATTTDQFENVRVFLNGVLLDSFDPSASSTAQLSANIDSSLTLSKGDNEIKVMVKAKSNATSGSIFLAKLSTDIFSGMNPEYVVSGNSVASVSGSATGAEFTVEGAALTTVRNDGYAQNKAIVRGSSDVSLGKFTLKASNDTVKITSLSLGANVGSTTATLSSSISDMKLFVDGVEVAGPVNFGTSGSNFSSLNISIAKDATKSFEIKGSFDSAAVENSYFATKMTVNAQDSRGTSISSGHEAYTTQFQVKAAGTLTVERGGDSPVDGLLATNSSEQEVAHFKFTAINDSANLTEINVVNWDSSAATTTAATDSRIASVRLYDGSTLVDQFVPVNGAGKFTINNNSVVVPANGSKTLSVRVTLNNIENDADATNKDLQIRVTSAKFKSSAGNESTSGSTNIDAYSFRIRKTVPTIAYQALPDTLLNAGDKVIAKFTVTADSNADVTVGKFTLLTSKTASSTLATTTNGLKVNGSNKAATQTLAGDNLTVLLTSPEIVAAGTTKTFEVIATVGVSGTGSESITAKIVEDAAYQANATLGSITGSFAWSDGASISAYTWAGSKNVNGLDTNTWTLSKN